MTDEEKVYFKNKESNDKVININNVGIIELNPTIDHPLKNTPIENIQETTEANTTIIDGIWNWIELNTLNHPDAVEKLIEFLEHQGGWFYYRELSELILLGNYEDDVVALSIDILVDAYEGNNWDKYEIYIPKNNKDQEIKDFLMRLLDMDLKKNSYTRLMNSLYVLFPQNEISQILDSPNFNKNEYISKNEVIDLRLKFMTENSLGKTMSIIGDLEGDEINRARNSLYYHINMISNGNDVILSGSSKKLIIDFLEENKPELNVIISSDDIWEDEKSTFSSEKDIEEWIKENEEKEYNQEYNISEFGIWSNAIGTLSSQSDIDAYMYNSAINAKNPIEKISIIQYQIEKFEMQERGNEIYSEILTDEMLYQLNDIVSDSKTPKEVRYLAEIFIE